MSYHRAINLKTRLLPKNLVCQERLRLFVGNDFVCLRFSVSLCDLLSALSTTFDSYFESAVCVRTDRGHFEGTAISFKKYAMSFQTNCESYCENQLVCEIRGRRSHSWVRVGLTGLIGEIHYPKRQSICELVARTKCMVIQYCIIN